jgi:hypothetical protein
VLGALAAAGVAGAGLIAVGVERALNAPSPDGEAAGVQGSPAASASAAEPSASAGGSAAPAGPRHAFRSRPDLTPPVISMTRGPADDAAAGLIFLTPGNGAGPDDLLIVDASGEPVWIGSGTQPTVADFTVVQLDGAPALCWWEGTNNNGIGSGEFVFADTSYRELRRLTGANGAKTDLHELLLTSSGTAIFFVTVPLKNDRATGVALPWPVMDCIVQELDLATGALVFEWHSADHIDVEESYAAVPTKSGAVYDYIHANAIEIDADGNLLVSARNTSAIYKVDRGSGNIIWRMGGKRSDFQVAPEAAFGWQHDIRRRPDGSLTLFDNANQSTDAPSGRASRAIVVAADEAKMTVELVHEYPHPTPLIVSSQGNAQLLPGGELFVGWGSTPWFTQFKGTGETVFDATFPASKQSYRALRFPWTARPVGQPALAIDRITSDTVAVYASWNGHTELASWEVLAGPSATSLAVVAKVPRNGFETRIPARTAGPLISVRALDASGGVLGSADPIAIPT